ncbi:hypothetical protein [Pseudanabaena sp. FACHB-2040]|uniref:DUF6930 domain-containing protein n=1 Tax=Pseudanabaena sp. FACHB-2040 TaxID=2692859 RepID=UPI001689CC5E|nr:hypothetical protein [Pseudanabaena sp. FACHB-2040]MBD2257254.1 hypothetical protein [Pseudanabaena sp. FACHB-2040]
MSTLSRIILQRLKQIPKIPSVWEADRREISDYVADSIDEGNDAGSSHSDCIIWVDGTQGTVRSLSVVPSDSGPEPLVRAFLQAMENPQGPQSPARPQKIVVRDRQIQFYLRGVLQDLDIAVDYVPELPLIDELFETLQQGSEPHEAELPERYASTLVEKAFDMWEAAPWNILNEQQILAVELNTWDIDTLYVSVLGMAGVEYGLLMYRSLESLKQFRQRVLVGDQSPKQMQEAFLEQDCLYLNFELIEGPTRPRNPLPGLDWLQDSPEAINPEFGSLHPLEGLRTTLVEEEGATLVVALEALNRFFVKHYDSLEGPPFPALQARYRIPNPADDPGRKTISITVKTLPEVADELMEQTSQAFSDQVGLGSGFPVLRDDFVPEGSLILLMQFSLEWVQHLRHSPVVYYQALIEPQAAPIGLPVVLIQTTRPKAQILIQDLQQAGGIKAVCFNQGRDLISGESYELGLLQSGDGEFHLFAEYQPSELTDKRILKHWQQWQQEHNGACGVVIAGGVTGTSKGKPQIKDIYAFFETTAQTSEALGLPPLQLQYALDWELDR